MRWWDRVTARVSECRGDEVGRNAGVLSVFAGERGCGRACDFCGGGGGGGGGEGDGLARFMIGDGDWGKMFRRGDSDLNSNVLNSSARAVAGARRSRRFDSILLFLISSTLSGRIWFGNCCNLRNDRGEKDDRMIS